MKCNHSILYSHYTKHSDTFLIFLWLDHTFRKEEFLKLGDVFVSKVCYKHYLKCFGLKQQKFNFWVMEVKTLKSVSLGGNQGVGRTTLSWGALSDNLLFASSIIWWLSASFGSWQHFSLLRFYITFPSLCLCPNSPCFSLIGIHCDCM